MRKSINRLTAFTLVLGLMTFAGCASVAPSTEQPTEKTAESSKIEPATDEDTDEAGIDKEDVYIVYTNDVHSYIYNTVTNENGEEVPGMRFSKLAAMVGDMRNEGKNVILVDAGDEIQGNVYGAFDEGESVIELMNKCGYQLATLGNHEFDYGMYTLFNRVEEADFPYISCNFHALDTDADPFAATHVFDMGTCKVAFVGITTPQTLTSSAPTYFQNEKGEYIYTIDGVEDYADMYAAVQKSVDAVRDEADYVIALAHVGIDREALRAKVSSYDVIANVSGIDAYIDGHSHSTVESETVKDKDGKDVVLTQTGCYLSKVGVMKLGAEGISTSLVSEYDNAVSEIEDIEDTVRDRLMEQMGQKIAILEDALYINNPDDSDMRYIRSREMNAGDFVADSIYWYFNYPAQLGCDVAIANGGGIRAQLEPGDITYLDARTVQPFGNMICLIEATGQQILDALEMGATEIGEWDDEWNIPAENGGFLQVAGMKYTIDATLPSSVNMTGDGMFESVDGDYRVRDVMIFDKEAGEYRPLELDKKYKVGGINYLLRNSGNGLCMFADDEMLADYVDQDYIITAEYIKNFAGNGTDACINSKNSPLLELDGYPIDYENPYGAERIQIVLE